MKEHIVDMLQYYGLAEIVGNKHNPDILKMFSEIGFDNIKDDETSWCSALVNYFCFKFGYERSRNLAARSWLGLGEPIEEKDVQIGDVVIFWRESIKSWKGHVAWFINFPDNKNVNVFGGNQGNMFNIMPYPKARVLGYRRLKKL